MVDLNQILIDLNQILGLPTALPFWPCRDLPVNSKHSLNRKQILHAQTSH